MQRSFVCAAWIGMLLAGDAWADQSGPYVSASLGRVEIRDKSELGGPLVVDKDKDDASWTLGVGLRFSRYIALDLGQQRVALRRQRQRAIQPQGMP